MLDHDLQYASSRFLVELELLWLVCLVSGCSFYLVRRTFGTSAPNFSERQALLRSFPGSGIWVTFSTLIVLDPQTLEEVALFTLWVTVTLVVLFLSKLAAVRANAMAITGGSLRLAALVGLSCVLSVSHLSLCILLFSDAPTAIFMLLLIDSSTCAFCSLSAVATQCAHACPSPGIVDVDGRLQAIKLYTTLAESVICVVASMCAIADSESYYLSGLWVFFFVSGMITAWGLLAEVTRANKALQLPAPGAVVFRGYGDPCAICYDEMCLTVTEADLLRLAALDAICAAACIAAVGPSLELLASLPPGSPEEYWHHAFRPLPALPPSSDLLRSWLQWGRWGKGRWRKRREVGEGRERSLLARSSMTSYLHTAAKCGFRGPSVEQLAATVAEGETTEGTGREEKRDRMREAMRKEQAMLQKYHQLEECQRAQALKKAALLRRQEESRRAEEQQLLAAEREAEAAAAMADEAEVTQKISRLTRQYGDSYLWKGTKPSVDGKGTKQFSRSKLDNEVLTAVGADVPTITY
ncbi:hypothetical protein DIPPA_33886 [Diplonema papillatum]|nr:hypothetical protein DIPPA_33886 [Diplonema papillatum]